MNEQIFELAKQADLIQWDSLPSGARTPDHESVVKAQKFAEMIVTACANVLIKWKDEPFPYDPEFGARLIKEHFGVEE